MKDVKILYKSKGIIVIAKPEGMPSQADPSGDTDALSRTAEQLSLSGERKELHIINRLDRVVGGLILFARDMDYASRLSALLTEGKILKEYIAVVSGTPVGGRLTDYLYKDARISKAFVVDKKRKGVKEAILDLAPVERVEEKDGIITLIKVRLKTGRYHQIRCQTASRGTPIVGDGKYGSRDTGARYPALYSYRLSFETMGERVDVTDYPDASSYPWGRFDLKKCEDITYD